MCILIHIYIWTVGSSTPPRAVSDAYLVKEAGSGDDLYLARSVYIYLFISISLSIYIYIRTAGSSTPPRAVSDAYLVKETGSGDDPSLPGSVYIYLDRSVYPSISV